jgi:two-component system, NtrC family, sensor histidine kinase HydH
MTSAKRPALQWMDLLWLVLLAGLAALPPVYEWHKQVILLAIGVVQIGEGWMVSRFPRRGPAYSVLLKIALATLLIDHTGELSINSSYWPIYFLPVVTAAEYFGGMGTLLWTALASAAYCSYLSPFFNPAIEDYDLTAESYGLLAIRILFFFMAAMVINRFVTVIRRRTEQYQELAETLAETNRRLEQAQEEARRSERLAALGQLSAGLAHEIRNPLGVIKGSAEMLAQKVRDTDPLAGELSGYILTETNRLSALVTRFLDFARPLHPELEPGNVTAVLDHALERVTTSWKGPAVTIQRRYQPELPRIGLDADLLEQAFVNLIQNAFEAMGPSGGTLRVEAASSAPLHAVEVAIEDDGPGIPPELREQIFNPFVTTRKTGVGLGLSIVAKIVDGHHGTIRIETAAHGVSGARFAIQFPAVAGLSGRELATQESRA